MDNKQTTHVKSCEMIILYGSYARGDYVLWDEYIDRGTQYSYQSDLDILVVVSDNRPRMIERQTLREDVAMIYHRKLEYRRHASPQFIAEQIETLNNLLEQKQYFFTDIVKEGIRIYDSGKFKLAKPRELSFIEIKEIAEADYKKFFRSGSTFLNTGFLNYKEGDEENYIVGSFVLHQACERFYNAISLVFTNYRPKTHKLPDLLAMVKGFSRELMCVFPGQTDFEKRCYDLLCRAYIEARYEKDFTVTREELEYMLSRIGILKEITERICTEKIASYDALIERDNTRES